ncbi:MAG: CHAT domain-containing protein [Candidatus Solibacter sp.]
MRKVTSLVTLSLTLLLLSASAQQIEPPASAEAAIVLIREMAQAQNLDQWFTANKAKITSGLAAAADVITKDGLSRGQGQLAFAASLFAARAHLQLGQRELALQSMLDQHQVRFMMAEKAGEYAALRKNSLDMAKNADGINRKDLTFAFATVAADSAYFQGQAPDEKSKDEVRLTALEDVLFAIPLLQYSTGRMWTERFVSLTGAVVSEATGELHVGQEKYDALLKKIAAATEQRIPADFEFTVPQIGDRIKTIATARELAELSYRYGNSQMGSARLAIAEQRAKVVGDLQLVTSLLYDRYRGEERSGASPEQLRRLRDDALSRAQAIRSEYRSRAGRIWAAYRSDEFYGGMLKGQLNDKTPDQLARVFRAAELLKARMLLDRMAMPQTVEVETGQSRELERKILGFNAPKLQGDLMLDEMRLVSQLAGFRMGSTEGSDRLTALRQLEEVYAKAGAGFKQAAEPPSLREVQAKLQAGEALLEYVIPYHPLHPASDLWMMLITREKVWSASMSLDAVLGVSSMTGRISVDGESPLDSSALGETVSLLRKDIRSSDDKRAKERLAVLYQVLIQPLVQQGARFEAFSSLIVVPHGMLHYVPFPALLDSKGAYLISKVPVTIAPSSSVWSLLTGRTSNADRFVGFANPQLKGRGLADLKFAEQEVAAIEKSAPAASRQTFSAAAATKATFFQEAQKASLLHISTHGEFPDDNALDLHAIWFAGPDGGAALRANEVRKMKLASVRLAVLNVCNGGLYRIGPSDEPYGLMPALLEAGAHNVLSTLWPMDDRFGRDFMIEFYKHLSEGPAKAHQKALLRFIGEDEFIRRWAGYVLVGQGRPFSVRPPA